MAPRMRVFSRYGAMGIVGLALLFSGAFMIGDIVHHNPGTTTTVTGGILLIIGSVTMLWAIGMLRLYLFDKEPQLLPLKSEIMRILRSTLVVALIAGLTLLLDLSYPQNLVICLAATAVMAITEILAAYNRWW